MKEESLALYVTRNMQWGQLLQPAVQSHTRNLFQKWSHMKTKGLKPLSFMERSWGVWEIVFCLFI